MYHFYFYWEIVIFIFSYRFFNINVKCRYFTVSCISMWFNNISAISLSSISLEKTARVLLEISPLVTYKNTEDRLSGTTITRRHDRPSPFLQNYENFVRYPSTIIFSLILR